MRQYGVPFQCRLTTGSHRRRARVGAPLKAVLDAAAKRSPIILTTSNGKPWTPGGFRASWAKASKRAGIVGLTFHDLRGTAVTRLAICNAPRRRSRPSPGTRCAACVRFSTPQSEPRSRACRECNQKACPGSGPPCSATPFQVMRAAPSCEVLTPCRGLRPHHVQQDRILGGWRESSADR
jgi:hypothetical protein